MRRFIIMESKDCFKQIKEKGTKAEIDATVGKKVECHKRLINKWIDKTIDLFGNSCDLLV